MPDVYFKILFESEGLKRIVDLVGEKLVRFEDEDEGLSKSDGFKTLVVFARRKGGCGLLR